MNYYSQLISLMQNSQISCNNAVKNLKLSLLAEIFAELSVSQDDLDYVQSHVYVHKDCTQAMYRILRNHLDKLSDEQLDMYTLFANKDLHNRNDLVKFVDMLSHFAVDKPELRRELNWLFAVDGISSEITYRHYIENLKYEIADKPVKPFDPIVYHLAGIRALYTDDNLNATPMKVRRTMFKVINGEKGKLASRYLQAIEDVKYEVIDFVLKPKIEKGLEGSDSEKM